MISSVVLATFGLVKFTCKMSQTSLDVKFWYHSARLLEFQQILDQATSAGTWKPTDMELAVAREGGSKWTNHWQTFCHFPLVGTGTGWLTIDGGYVVLALLEWEAGELGGDGGGALRLCSLKGQHRVVLIQTSKASTVRVEGPIVVFHECAGHRVCIHRRRRCQRAQPKP
ncbi:hypothetical protein M5K25_010771 [Dendrobium thyrsiflorum]|uniref:Uncharacterized protein n=1 Tax=Dendrobium thyrsiflorum TaxID=117978 RepID=A0ABD0V1H0_DENTH